MALPEHLSQADLFTFVSPPWEKLFEDRCLTTLHHTGDLCPLRISLLAYKLLQLTKVRNEATSEILSLWLKRPFQNSSRLNVKQLQEKLGKRKEVRRLVNKHLKILHWPSTREWEREHAGDPLRTRRANLARSGIQSECRIRFVFPARGFSHIMKYNTTDLILRGQYLSQR